MNKILGFSLPWSTTNDGWFSGWMSSAQSYSQMTTYAGWAGLALAGVFIWRGKCCRVKRAQVIGVSSNFSFNHGDINLTAPLMTGKAPNGAVVICVDCSESTKEHNRLVISKAAIKQMFTNAQRVVDLILGAQFTTSVVRFAGDASVVNFNSDEKNSDAPVIFKAGDTTLVPQLCRRVDELKSDGGTLILSGFELGIEQMKVIAKANPKADKVLVVLSDGEDSTNGVAPQYIAQKPQLRQQLKLAAKQLGARVITIGVGKEHDVKAMQELAHGVGEYIAATEEKNLPAAIARAYHGAIPSFSRIRLSTSQLPAGSWMWINKLSEWNADQKTSFVEMDTLPEGKIETKLHLIPNRNEGLDVEKTVFQLSWVDRQGRVGSKMIRWAGSSVIKCGVLGCARE